MKRLGYLIVGLGEIVGDLSAVLIDAGLSVARRGSK